MKILLLALPRSGSTTFMYMISHLLNLRCETINDKLEDSIKFEIIKKYSNRENIIVRLNPLHINEIIDFELLKKSFDRIILLSRYMDDDYYKSIVNLYYRENILGYGWNNSYVYEEIPREKINWKVVENIWKTINDSYNQLHVISKKYNLPIIDYHNFFNLKEYSTLSKVLEKISTDDISNYLLSKDRYRKKISKKYKI